MKKFLGLCVVASANIGALFGNPVDLSGPAGLAGYASREGGATYQLDFQQADAGDGAKLPVRFIFDSRNWAESRYKWTGWSVPLIDSHVKEIRSDYYEVVLLCGKRMYFNKIGPGTQPGQTLFKNQETDWTGTLWTTTGVTWFEIVRWDGWKLKYKDGILDSLTTDGGKVIRWDNTGFNRTTRKIYLQSNNETIFEVTYSGASSAATPASFKVNTDVYSLDIQDGLLREIESPDGTIDSFDYTNYSSFNLVTGNPSGSGQPTASTSHTNRFGVQTTLTWASATGFITNDGPWNYTVTLPSSDGVPNANVTRTRIATGETDGSTSGSNNSVKTITSAGGVERRVFSYMANGPLFGKVYKVEEKRNGDWVTVSQSSFDETTGRLLRSTDALLNDTLYAYTNHPSASPFAPPKTKTITDATGRATEFEYDVRGNLIKVDAAGVSTSYVYDNRDRRIQTKNDANVVVAEIAYNNNDAPTSVKDALGNETKFTYLDRHGESLLTKVESPSGITVEYTYDAKGNRLTTLGANGQTWTTTYDSNNLPEKVADPMTNETEFEFDPRANLTRITNALNQVVEMGYDDLDLVDSITNALSQTSAYENRGDTLLKELSDNRAKEYEFSYNDNKDRSMLKFPDASELKSEYDAAGRLSKWIGRGGADIVIARDAVGRITQRSWTHGSLSGNATFSFDAGGRLSASTASIPSGGTLSQAFAYDSEGRVNDVELQMRGAGITYNANNQIASIAYPAGFTISYSYDSDGRLTEISKDSTPLTSYRYDSAGRLEEREDSNGVVTDYTYDTLSRVTGITITKTGTGVIWSNTYGYNAVGNRVYTEFIGGKGDAYQYDAIGQVTGVKYHADNADSGYNTATNAGKTETFGYDAAGNRNASSATGLAPLTYGVNDINQYTSISDSSTPTYNSRGDVATYDGWTYSYNAAGNLIKAVKGSTTLEYFYDGFGNRVGEKQGSETAWLLHLGTTVLESHKSVAGTQTSYIHGSGIDAPVAQVLNGGALEFVYQDVLGNIVLLANASGSIVETYRYGVWGDVRVFDASGTLLTTAPKSRYLFTGRDYDAETGLYHYRTRAYSPKLGRFMQIDSIDFGGSDLNLYRYVANNPLNFADPLGMEAECTRLNSRVLKEWDTDRYYIKSQKMRAFDVLGLVNDFVGNSMMELWVNKYGRDFTMRQVEQWNCKDPCTGRQWTEERKKDLRSDTEYYYEPELRFAG